jgi:hypothetical protein
VRALQLGKTEAGKRHKLALNNGRILLITRGGARADGRERRWGYGEAALTDGGWPPSNCCGSPSFQLPSTAVDSLKRDHNHHQASVVIAAGFFVVAALVNAQTAISVAPLTSAHVNDERAGGRVGWPGELLYGPVPL